MTEPLKLKIWKLTEQYIFNVDPNMYRSVIDNVTGNVSDKYSKVTDYIQLSEYNKLSSKYEFNKIACIQNNEFQDIDILIKNINSLGNNSTRNNINKKYDASKHNVYLEPKFLNFCRSNSQSQYFTNIFEEMNCALLQNILNRVYEYLFHKIKNTDEEIYNELKLISASNRHSKRDRIKTFINKWTTKTKTIKIGL